MGKEKKLTEVEKFKKLKRFFQDYPLNSRIKGSGYFGGRIASKLVGMGIIRFSDLVENISIFNDKVKGVGGLSGVKAVRYAVYYRKYIKLMEKKNGKVAK